jgi:hypothetical protein
VEQGMEDSQQTEGAAMMGISPPRFLKGEPFLSGPIPLSWLTAASLLPGKCLHVGLFVWYLAGLTKSIRVKLSTSKLAAFGVNRQAAYRAVTELENSHLLLVERMPGRCPVVSLVIPTSSSTGASGRYTNLSRSTTPVAIC